MSAKQKMPMRATFPDTVLSDTAMLTHEEKGVLSDIENNMWVWGGWLPDDDRKLCKLIRISYKRWQKMKPKLSDRFLVVGEKFTIKTLLSDYNKAIQISETNKKNGIKGGHKRWENSTSMMATGMATNHGIASTQHNGACLGDISDNSGMRMLRPT